MASCVPARKYEELKAKSANCSDSLSSVSSRHKDLQAQHKELNTVHDRIKKEHDILTRDTTVLGQSYRHLKTQYDHIDKNNRRIQEQLEFLQKQLERESSNLGSELEKKKSELQRKEDELRKLTDDLKRLEENLKRLENELNEKERLLVSREKRVNELEDMLRKKDEAVNALKEKISGALLSFRDKGLTVEERNGKIYVSMEAKLLFASGSINVEAEGKKALVELAKVLENDKDLEIIVEGHTDTDKMSGTSHPKDNWELSVLRATSVTKIMLDNSKMDSKQISAAGRSEYLPVDPANKAKNRRIEIIIMPNLDELYKIIEKK